MVGVGGAGSELMRYPMGPAILELDLTFGSSWLGVGISMFSILDSD
jgi:hypothetical protein